MQTHTDDRAGDTFVLVFASGEDPTRELLDFARRERIAAAEFRGIGAFARATIGYFDVASKEYRTIAVETQTEVLSLIGNLSVFEDAPRLHAHVVLGFPDGAARGGHLLEARVHPTLELFVRALPFPLRRERDEASGLPLIGPA